MHQDTQPGHMAPRIVAAILLFPPLAIFDGWSMRRASRGAAIMILLAATLAIGVHLMLIAAVLVVHLMVDGLPPWWLRSLVILITTIAALLIGIEWICRRASRPIAAWIGTCACVVVIGGISAWFLRPLEFTNAIAFRVPILAMLDSIMADKFDYRAAGKYGIRPPSVTLSALPDATFGDHTEMFAGCHIPIDASWQKEERQEQTLNFAFGDSSRIVFYKDNPISEIASGSLVPSHMDAAISAAMAAEHDLALMRSIYETSYDDIQAARNFEELIHAELRYVLKISATIPQPPVVAFESEHLRGFFSVQQRPRYDFTPIEAVAYDPSGTFRFRITARRAGIIEEAEAAQWITSILANIDCSPLSVMPGASTSSEVR